MCQHQQRSEIKGYYSHSLRGSVSVSLDVSLLLI